MDPDHRWTTHGGARARRRAIAARMALAALVAMLAALVACAALLRPAAAGAATATQAAPPPPLLDVAFGDDAAFNISVAGENWVGSAPIRAFAAGEWQKLTHTGTTRSSGSDVLGEFSCVNVSWVTGGGLVLHTSLKTYAGLDMSIFVQQMPGGATGTNASNPVLPGGLRVMDPGNYDPVVAFPALSGGQLEQLGFVTWQSRMINVELGVNVTQVRSLLSNERALPCFPAAMFRVWLFRACLGKASCFVHASRRSCRRFYAVQGPPGDNEPLITGRGLQGLSTSGPVVLFDDDFNSLVVRERAVLAPFS
jgi:hypothetical protein